jgi:hypothetical protein
MGISTLKRAKKEKNINQLNKIERKTNSNEYSLREYFLDP